MKPQSSRQGKRPAQRRRPIDESDVLRIKVPLDPQISPDGRKVAFVLRAWDEKAGKDSIKLWLAFDEGPARPLTTGPSKDWAPRFSPDGRRIAFLTDRRPEGMKEVAGRARHQVAIIPLDGGEAQLVTHLDATLSAPSWSPDGRRLAFAMRPNDPIPEGEERLLEIRVRRVPYKANGAGYLPQARGHVFVIDTDGKGTPRALTRGDFDDEGPVWSPDGRWIAFLSQRRRDREHDLENVDLFVVSPEGGPPRQLSRLRGSAAVPSWSPDGSRIAFVECPGPRGNCLKDNMHLFVVPADGSRAETDLTSDLDRNVLNLTLEDTVGLEHMAIPPVWDDGGGALVFPVSDEGRTRICRVTVGGGGRGDTVKRAVESVLDEGTVAAFTGSAQARRLAVIWTDHVTPPRLEIVDLAAQSRLVVAEPSAQWASGVEIVAPEEIEVPSTEGATVQGWLLRPPRKGKLPMVLYVHGGPNLQYGNAFFLELQALAAKGFAVLYTNPRGSQGYGRAFARAIDDDWATRPFADLLAAVDRVAVRDGIDGRRLGVAGGSYGGYMTLWIVGQTDRFKAACAQRVVCDLGAMVWSDSGGGLGDFLGAWPWEAPERYRRQSPITYAERVKTPLLILQGLSDQRTPADQGEKMFVTLKTMDKDVEMVVFPGADHDLSRTGPGRQRVARLRAITEWFVRRLEA